MMKIFLIFIMLFNLTSNSLFFVFKNISHVGVNSPKGQVKKQHQHGIKFIMENLEGEKWLPVVGYEGAFEVSDMGRVKSLKRPYDVGTHGVRFTKEHILSPSTKERYRKVQLSCKPKRETGTIHRLVAMAFIPNPLNLPCVNHIDCNKDNNCVSNLEWCTYQHNSIHAIENNLNVKFFGKENHYSISVGKFDLNNNLIEKFETLGAAAKVAGKSQQTITNHCKGLIEKGHLNGYKWRYI